MVFPTDPSTASWQNTILSRTQTPSTPWIRLGPPSQSAEIAFDSTIEVAVSGAAFPAGTVGVTVAGGASVQLGGVGGLGGDAIDHSIHVSGSGHGMDDRKAMKRREMGSLLRLGVGALLMWFAGQAFASFPATDAERAVLPIYCKDTMGFAGYGDSSYNTSPRAKTWVAKMGETFWAMHHYCVGLVKRNRALRAGVSPTERKFLMESAVGEYAYVLNNLKDPNFVLLPEIYTRVG